MSDIKKVILWGATGQARVINELLDPAQYELVLVVDNREVPPPIKGLAMAVGESGLRSWLAQQEGQHRYWGVAAIGGMRGADRLAISALMVGLDIQLMTLVHPSAYVARDAILGQGVQILANATVCTHARLGDGVIVNTGASVDHDGVIGAGTHIGPGAKLAGEVIVGARAFVATGAVVLPRIVIGDDAVVGAGAVVTRNVAPNTTVVGNPAKLLIK